MRPALLPWVGTPNMAASWKMSVADRDECPANKDVT